MERIISKLIELNISYEESVDLKKKTWIHRGGNAGLFITPKNARELEDIIRFLYFQKIDFLLIGHTSNLYINNDCNLDVVVSTIKCNHYRVEDDCIVCEAGVGVTKLSNDMIGKGISGFEYLTCLPGTIGGALINNSSCKLNSISSLLINARVLLEDGVIKLFKTSDFNYTYRNSSFKNGSLKGTILSATLKRIDGESSNLLKIAEANIIDRKKRLGGYSNNLGCIVNKADNNGRMDWYYRLIVLVIRVYGKILNKDRLYINKTITHALCCLTHYKNIESYISSYNPIVFVWKDEGADTVFPLYLEFMKRVYKLSSLEIQIIK